MRNIIKQSGKGISEGVIVHEYRKIVDSLLDEKSIVVGQPKDNDDNDKSRLRHSDEGSR